MMTPAQLKAYEFKTAGRNAYRSDDVDTFFGEVLVNYEKMFRENSELIKRVSLLADKLEQYKNDEVDIKEAVLSAQKAANLIVKEAEDSIADSKNEAEAILAAAKGEAEIIKADAEKQAIADSELALSLAKDKAEDIIAKAKEKARGILIAANDSASDTMGAANRTITSESLHYDMLKKEVSEFRASILAQYKAHIEMISKLPEIAVEEAAKIENVTLPEKSVDEIEEYVDNGFTVSEASQEDAILEYVDDASVEESEEDTVDAGEPVVKTELPYDFFEGDSQLQFVDDEQQEQEAPTVEEFENILEAQAQAEVTEEASQDELCTESDEEADEDVESISSDDTSDNAVASDEIQAQAEENASQTEDISISHKRFSVDVNRIDYSMFEDSSEVQSENAQPEDSKKSEPSTSFFDMFEKIDDNSASDLDEKPEKRRGLFRKKK